MSLTLSRHAAQRCAEFGIGLDVVATIARRPDVTHTNPVGERVCTADAYPDWTVVVGAADVVVTVLRRTPDRWEHQPMDQSRSRTRLDVDRSLTDPPPSTTDTARRRPREPARRVGAVSRPVAVQRIDPAAIASALAMAGGDVRRLVLNPDDGSVTVLNRPRGTR